MLEIINVSKVYKNKTEKVYALKNCSLSINENQFIIISGKSGSGKTTLINLIGSLETPSSGDILYNNQSIFLNNQEYRNQVIGFIFQEHNLIEHLTVKENISLALELQGQAVSDDEVLAILKKVSLEEYIDKYPNQLSTGQHQRCAIARALIKSPKIIIADEPTGSLDENTGNHIMDLLKELSKEYLVIMVTHNIDYPKKYADRHIVIENGMIIQDEIINPNSSDIKESKSLNDCSSKLMLDSKKNYIKQYLKVNTSHLLRTILILSISMFLLLLFYTSLNIDQSRMIYKTITSDKSSSVYYINNNFVIDEERDDGHYFLELNTGFYTRDIEKMKKKYNNQNIYPIYRRYISLEEYINYPPNLIFTGDVSGLIEIDKTLLNNFKYKLIEGNLPKEFNENQVEIAIPKFLYEFLNKYGIDNTNIIGNIIEYNNVNYKITGVIDTNYDTSYYKEYFLTNNSKIDENKKEQYQKLIESEIHTAFFVPVNYIKTIKDDNYVLEISNLDEVLICNENLSHQLIYISKYINNNNIIFNDSKTSTLNNNEAIIDISLLNSNINYKIEKLVIEFAENHYDEISNEFEKKYPGSNYHNYVDYILTHENNEYHPDKSYMSFLSIILKEEMDKINSQEPTIKVSSIKGIFEERINIIGISLYDENKIILSNNYFNKVKNVSYGTYKTILVKASDKFSNDKSIIRDFNHNKNIDNSILSTFYTFISTFESLKPFLIILFSFFTLTTIILMLYFINDLLKSAKKDIGLILALGARKKDVKQIYCMTLSIIILLSILLSIIFLLLLSPLVNSFLKNEYNLFTNVLFINYQVITIYVVSLLIIFTIIVYILLKVILRNKSLKSLYINKNKF